MPTNSLTKREELLIVELFKAHFLATETADQLSLPYAAVAAIYRGLKVASIEKYDRRLLIPDTVQLRLQERR